MHSLSEDVSQHATLSVWRPLMSSASAEILDVRELKLARGLYGLIILPTRSGIFVLSVIS